MAELIEHRTREALAETVADEIAEALRAAIETKDEALLALSGGTSPGPVHEALAAAPLDWSRVTVTLVDERWVEEDHDKSNAAMIRRTLLKGAAADARFQPLKTDAATPAAGLADVEAALAELPFPPDAALMGMGIDGHTASWFPGAEGLDEALNGLARAAAISGASGAAASGQDQRITLTAAALEGSRWIGLMILGAEKRAALDAAMAPGAVEDMPVRAILRARPDLRVHWAA